MKNIILLFSLLFVSSLAFGQEQMKAYSMTDFDKTFNLPITVDTSMKNNLWQVGILNKRVINQAYSGKRAIVTDSLTEYAKNNTSAFTFKITPLMRYRTNSLGFNHIYETDAKKDGGMIETSYDSGKTWYDILTDTMYGKMLSSNNMYSSNDSVAALNSPGFSGRIKSWSGVVIYWEWTKALPKDVLIRFIFKSDSIDNKKDGWAVDDIRLITDLFIGSINNGILQTNQAQPYPNPCTENLNFNFESGFSGEVKIFNAEGKIIRCESYQNQTLMQLPMSGLPVGIYLVQTKDEATGNSKLYKVVKQL